MFRFHAATTHSATYTAPPSALGWLLGALAEPHRRQNLRAELGGLSPAHLRDIGLSEADIEAACHQPLTVNAADWIGDIATGRPANW